MIHLWIVAVISPFFYFAAYSKGRQDQRAADVETVNGLVVAGDAMAQKLRELAE